MREEFLTRKCTSSHFYQGIICILVRVAGCSDEGSRFHREAIRVVSLERSSKARSSLPTGELNSIDVIV